METSCQPSYPLNSEKESPPGTFKVYLSCAEMAKTPSKASAPLRIGIVLLPFIVISSLIKSSVLWGGLSARGGVEPAFKRARPNIPLRCHSQPRANRIQDNIIFDPPKLFLISHQTIIA